MTATNVWTTGLNRFGHRVFRLRSVELADRPMERDFISASGDRPAQHRVYEVRRDPRLDVSHHVPLLVVDFHDVPEIWTGS